MVADEVEHEAGFVGVKLEAIEDAAGEADGFAGVGEGGVAFAGVVEEGGEEEQLGVRKLLKNGGEAGGPGFGRGFGGEGVEGVDEDEGVLVDGVAVVGVADDEGVDAVELGQDELQDAEGVHGAEGVAGERSGEDGAEMPPEAGAVFEVSGEERECGFEAALGGGGEAGSGAGQGGEEVEGDFGVVLGEWVCLCELDTLVAELEAGLRGGGTA